MTTTIDDILAIDPGPVPPLDPGFPTDIELGTPVLADAEIQPSVEASTEALDAGEVVDVDSLGVQMSMPDRDQVRRYTFLVAVPPDPHTVAARNQTDLPVVRRPRLGLEAYEDSYASLEIIASEGDQRIKLINTSYREGEASVTTNFLLSQVGEPREEVVEIIPTFGDFFVQDSGTPIDVVSLSGVLLESKNFPWLREWRVNYSRFLRARQCILRRAMAYLTIGNTLYVGYIIASQTSRNWEAWGVAPLSLTMVIRSVSDVYAADRFHESRTQGIVQDGPEGRATSGIRIPDTVMADPRQTRALLEAQGAVRNLDDIQNEVVRDAVERLDTLQGAPVEGDDKALDALVRERRALEIAQAIETVQGRPEALELLEPVLSDAGTQGPTVSRFAIDELVSVANQINRRFPGYVNVGSLRRWYMTNRRAELEVLGQYDPFGPAQYGLPTAYQDQVDAQRRRQQEQWASTVTGALERQFRDPESGRFRVL